MKKIVIMAGLIILVAISAIASIPSPKLTKVSNRFEFPATGEIRFVPLIKINFVPTKDNQTKVFVWDSRFEILTAIDQPLKNWNVLVGDFDHNTLLEIITEYPAKAVEKIIQDFPLVQKNGQWIKYDFPSEGWVLRLTDENRNGRIDIGEEISFEPPDRLYWQLINRFLRERNPGQDVEIGIGPEDEN